MRADWPIEALKAQAVVARSYALAKLNPQRSTLPWHLDSSDKNQVSGSFYDTTAATDRAAQATKGEVLADRLGKPVEGFFHSKCGGHTLRPDQVWSGNVEGYRGVTCPYCHKHGKAAWREKVSKEKFADLLSRAITRYGERPVRVAARELTLVGDAPHRSELRVYSGNELHVVKKSWLRNLAGRELFPSHRFTLADQGPYLSLSGEGLGHGVGLCQLGALELAKRGYDYRAILQHYFPEFKITRVWQ
jgi:stage II sporulation protein D